ncbi:hypothetical protein Dsin_028178 [Dipteronia sinensis]|uniref:RNase H type-1 domain-containing protein n=1 Tax=Dipteronia sinensis TaxID=43782 RepID=A0AAD9ZR94_9ROSI|nr:hypothetical protein Dsin_028178 [Dipteronia sinensis]
MRPNCIKLKNVDEGVMVKRVNAKQRINLCIDLREQESGFLRQSSGEEGQVSEIGRNNISEHVYNTVGDQNTEVEVSEKDKCGAERCLEGNKRNSVKEPEVYQRERETRNNKVFKDVEAIISQAEDMVRFRVAWWFKYLGGGSSDPITHMLLNIKECCLDSRKMKAPKKDEWFTSPIDALKFNDDCSARGDSGPAGIGEIFCNHGGKVLYTFSTSVGIHDALIAEILTIARACEICGSKPELFGKMIVVVSDSKVAVTLINNEGVGSLKHAQAIYDISNYISSSCLRDVLPQGLQFCCRFSGKKKVQGMKGLAYLV